MRITNEYDLNRGDMHNFLLFEIVHYYYDKEYTLSMYNC